MTAKQILLLVAFLSCMPSASVYADPNSIILTVTSGNEDPYENNTGLNRGPVRLPQLSVENHTLYIYSGCDNTTIELLEVNGQVVYTADVAEGTETLTLPASLTGTFELRIIRGSFTFVGEIDL